MNRPDFKEVKRLIKGAEAFDASFQEMFRGIRELEQAAKNACDDTRMRQAEKALSDIPTDELKASASGIRVAALHEAGYHTLEQLSKVSDRELLAISGIGEKQVSAIRVILSEFLKKLSARSRISLPADMTDGQDLALLTAVSRFWHVKQIEKDALAIRDELHESIEASCNAITIRSRVRWVFSFPGTREESVRAIGDLMEFCRSPLYHRGQLYLSQYQKAVELNQEQALESYKKNSASYYALLEKLTGSGVSEALIYSSIPAKLASEIRGEELELEDFRGNLRAYQEFGARYILHQKRVLLGDEMGLGKTIQAIAAMSHLHCKNPDCHFLIVCPASVMINWCREIEKFSRIKTQLLHGRFWDVAFDHWKQDGGAAVTNYESMEKIAGLVNNRMKLALLVIDEAHYIKNPEAKRTQNIHMLEDESERILLMTGTPLENKVGEMCELVRFVRPDMAVELRASAGLRFAPQFREMLAPVYLRRLREDVLTELPPVTEQEEWCAMTAGDLAAYGQQVLMKNFMAMRRVSFLQEDLTTSSKAARLRELCDEMREEGRKAVIYSYFRETVRKVSSLLEKECTGVLTGSVPVAERQKILDHFEEAPAGSVLICQIQAGGTGLNLQSASVVIFCEPQIKPSLTNQAIARAWRMGQVQNVLVCHLLCEQTVDEAVLTILREKQEEFDTFAQNSAMADAAGEIVDKEWVRQVLEEQRMRYLPSPIVQY